MTDIHPHPAVAFLMTTEFWPVQTDNNGRDFPLEWHEHQGGFVWGDGSYFEPLQWAHARSLIFAAAVRWLGSMGWTLFIRGGIQAAYCEIVRGKTKVVKSGPTDLHALLDAVEAVRRKETK